MRRMERHTISSCSTSPLPKSTCSRRSTSICLANHGTILFWHFIVKAITWIEFNCSFCPLLSLRQSLDKIIISSISQCHFHKPCPVKFKSISFPSSTVCKVEGWLLSHLSQSMLRVCEKYYNFNVCALCYLNIIMRKKKVKKLDYSREMHLISKISFYNCQLCFINEYKERSFIPPVFVTTKNFIL